MAKDENPFRTDESETESKILTYQHKDNTIVNAVTLSPNEISHGEKRCTNNGKDKKKQPNTAKDQYLIRTYPDTTDFGSARFHQSDNNLSFQPQTYVPCSSEETTPKELQSLPDYSTVAKELYNERNVTSSRNSRWFIQQNQEHTDTEPKTVFTSGGSNESLIAEIPTTTTARVTEEEEDLSRTDPKELIEHQRDAFPSEKIPDVITVSPSDVSDLTRQTVRVGEDTNVVFGDLHLHFNARASNREKLESGASVANLTNLRLQLRTRAEESSDDIQLPVDVGKAVRIVKLQLSKCDDASPSQLDEIGHFNRRSDYRAIYETPRGNVALSEIFDFARNKTTSDASTFSGSGAAKTKWIQRGCNKILILGQAGIGKTVITKMIVRLVLKKQILPDCEYLFYVRFRDIDFESKKTLLDVLISACGCDWSSTPETRELLWERLKANPNVLVVLDGLDEAGTAEMLRSISKCNPLAKEKVSTHLKCLVSGTALPEAKVVVTSRPREGNGLHADVRPRTVLQVLGLDEDAQRELGEEICGENWNNVKAYLEEHPQIHAICYVPVICVLVMCSLCFSLENNNQMELNTVSRVLLSALVNYVHSEYMREDSCELKKLSLLAWQGFRGRKALFDACDLQKAGISHLPPQSFLSTSSQAPCKFRLLKGGSKKNFFSHMVWLEMFASIYLLLYSPNAIFAKSLQKLKRRRWEVVAKCLFGLCNDEVHPALRELFPDANFVRFNERKKSLTNLITSALQRTATSAQRAPDRFEKLLRVCGWMRELDDPTVSESAARFLPKKITLHGDVFPADVSSLIYALKNRDEDVETTMNVRFRTYFRGRSLFALFEEVSKMDNVKMRYLTLSLNKIDDKAAVAISKCLRNVKVLYLDRSDLSEIALNTIAQAIGQLQQSLEEVNLTGITITDQSARVLAGAFGNIDALFVLRCGISPAGCKALCEAIRNRITPMTELNMRGNHVTEEMCEAVASCLTNIRRLYVHDCQVTARGAKFITDAIANRPTPMDELYMYMNPIGDEGAIEVSRCLSNITSEVRLDKCGITRSGYEDLLEAYQDATNKPEIHLGWVEGVEDKVTLTRRSPT